MARRRRLKIDILAVPETTGSVLYGLFDALSTAGISYPRLVAGDPGEFLSDVRIVAATRGPFTCRAGTPIVPNATLSEAVDADIICVSSISFPLDQSPQGRFPEEVEWLRQRYAAGATIAAACGGSILLAETGLLDGNEATVHWAYSDLFRRYYPGVVVRSERVLTFSGEGDRLIAAGGMAAWQDLALYLIARFLGAEYAVQTAKILVFSGHEEGQSPYAALSRRIQKDDPVIAECQAWVAENYFVSQPVAQMAGLGGLSKRTFSRRFKIATGFRPMEYVHAVRIEEAKQLLESSSSLIDEIALEVGYEDSRSFRRLFARKTGISPNAYRRRFSHAGFQKAH